MAKQDYIVRQVSKAEALTILGEYHYLTKETGTFKSGKNFGLFHSDRLCGVAIFTGFPVRELLKGAFGLEGDDQEGFWELSRLCLDPVTQSTEHNITSWFLSRSIRQLRKITKVRALLSYADSEHHEGTIYRACNFVYYGLTTAKSDFWIKQSDGSYKKHQRGKVRGLEGEWRPRARKHRFLICYDKTLSVQWEALS